MRMQYCVSAGPYKRVLRYVLSIIALLLGQGVPWFFPAAHAAEGPIEQARRMWAQSPHGRMLERILPPVVGPRDLPEASAEGARLTARYCVQCHHLPSPHMHTADRWKPVVERMVWRMRGNGNMGELMKDMMAHVKAPSDREVQLLTRYLEKHAQKEIASTHPALTTPAGQIFSLACSQCHALPDPRRHTAREWPRVVERMKQHMAWSNTVVGAAELRTTPELNTTEIVRVLQQYARPEENKR
jgi:cytochrome c5